MGVPRKHRQPWTPEETDRLKIEMQSLMNGGWSMAGAAKQLRHKLGRRPWAIIGRFRVATGLMKPRRTALPRTSNGGSASRAPSSARFRYLAIHRDGNLTLAADSPEELVKLLAEAKDSGDLARYDFYRATPVQIKLVHSIEVCDA